MRSRRLPLFGFMLCVSLVLMSHAAFAHHVMGGKLPGTFIEGALSGLGHPIIGIDHLAGVLAVGCVAAAYRLGPALIVGYVLAQVAGAALHVRGAAVPGAEMLVAVSVLVLGAATLRRQSIATSVALGLFVAAGLVHGYALAESIVDAEPSPLAAYFAGLVVAQAAVAVGAMATARWLGGRGNPEPVRLAGAVIAGVGLAILVQQLIPNA